MPFSLLSAIATNDTFKIYLIITWEKGSWCNFAKGTEVILFLNTHDDPPFALVQPTIFGYSH